VADDGERESSEKGGDAGDDYEEVKSDHEEEKDDRDEDYVGCDEYNEVEGRKCCCR
jgi:hypothetical protein